MPQLDQETTGERGEHLSGARACVVCERLYHPLYFRAFSPEYLRSPHWYADGIHNHCLACWLGIPFEADDRNLSDDARPSDASSP